jgi:hypothetical protein
LGTQNRQVSLANIATAFLTDRKSSSHRQSSVPRKKRLTNKGLHKRQSSYTTAADEILAQRLSADNMEGGIATFFANNGIPTNGDNTHRSTMVKVNPILFLID